MAAANTSTNPNDSFAAWLAGQMTPEQAAAASGPVVQAPTARALTQGYDANAGNESVPGPYDKFRAQKPSDIDQTWWNQYIDSRNYAFNNLPDQSRKDAAIKTLNGMTTAEFVQYARQASPQDLARDGGKYAPKVNAAQASFAAGIPTVSAQGGLRGAPTPGAPTPQQVNQQAITGAVNTANQQTQALADKQAADTQAYWGQTVDPALAAQKQAVAAQVTGDRAWEGQLAAAGNQLGSSLDATQAQRLSGISSANAAQSAALQQLQGALSQSNSALDSNLSGYQSALNQNNAGLNQNLGQLRSAYSSADADARQNLGNLQGQLTNYTNAQNAALGQLQGSLQGQTNEEYQAVNTLVDQLTSLNIEDRQSYMDYLQKTNPQLATMVAQASDPKYVQQQQDVYNQYKAQSSPEVTAQERLLAEQARLKTENDNKSSSDAAYAALQARGLNSGGQQIAAQLANRQSTSSDRVLAELGLQSNAVSRAQTNLAGAAGVAGQLRSADDAMKQFSDQYAQNDAIRRSNLALQQNQQGLATTGQMGARNQTQFDATRANINDATQRSTTGYNAATDTNNANTGRAVTGFNASQSTTNDIAGRAQNSYNAGYQTLGAQAANAGSAYNAGYQTTGAKTANAGTAFDATGKTIDSNFGRSASGWSAADAIAGAKYGTASQQAQFGTGNLASEVGSAAGLTGSSLAAAGGYTGMRSTTTAAQQAAIDKILGNTIIQYTPYGSYN